MRLISSWAWATPPERLRIPTQQSVPRNVPEQQRLLAGGECDLGQHAQRLQKGACHSPCCFIDLIQRLALLGVWGYDGAQWSLACRQCDQGSDSVGNLLGIACIAAKTLWPWRARVSTVKRPNPVVLPVTRMTDVLLMLLLTFLKRAAGLHQGQLDKFNIRSKHYLRSARH